VRLHFFCLLLPFSPPREGLCEQLTRVQLWCRIVWETSWSFRGTLRQSSTGSQHGGEECWDFCETNVFCYAKGWHSSRQIIRILHVKMWKRKRTELALESVLPAREPSTRCNPLCWVHHCQPGADGTAEIKKCFNLLIHFTARWLFHLYTVDRVVYASLVFLLTYSGIPEEWQILCRSFILYGI